METAIIKYDLTLPRDPARPVHKPLDSEQEWMLQLMLALHASLDINRIIATFSKFIERVIPHDHISYSHPRFQIQFTSGKKCAHHVRFHIHSGQISLGELHFSRDKAFGLNESLQLEDMMVHLMNPLNNALALQEALAQAQRDPLTQVGNRSAMEQALNRDTELAKRYSTPFSILALDIDYFKKINDTHGHLAGDAYLKAFALCIKETIRESDAVYRSGGEEFIVLLGETGAEGAIYLADRLRKALSQLMCDIEGAQINTTTSIGIASFVSGDSQTSVLHRADQALYQAKCQGRDRICL